jgi:diguanylate cyclase (GGDEF)-like protein
LNRFAFGDRLAHEWNTLSRDGRPLALLLAEVDDFQRCVDELGQPAVDTVLQQIATMAGSVLRPSDLLVRWGCGFGVLLPDLEAVGALHMAERFRTGVEQAVWPDRPVTVSIGASAVMPSGGASPYELLTRSDRALSVAKGAGGNRSQLFVGPYW